MENRKPTEAENLELIAAMLRQARNRLTRNNGRIFLLMGYTTVAVSLAVWLGLTRTGDGRWNWLWFLILAVWTGYGIADGCFRRSRETLTYAERAVGMLWGVLGAAAFVTTATALFRPIPILFCIILLMSVGAAVTGLLLRFRPLTATGLLVLCCTPLCVVVQGPDSILLFAALYGLLTVIPGHLLAGRFRREQHA